MINSNNGILAWFIVNPVTANLLMALIIILGVMGIYNARVEGWPTIPGNTITIDIPFQGGSPEELELALAVKVENALRGLSGVKSIFSHVQSNNSHTTVTATEGYSIAQLKEQITTRIDGINDFPRLAERPIITETIYGNSVIRVELYGDIPHKLLRQTAVRIQDELLRLDSVNKITMNGALEPEINIQIKPKELRRFNLSLQEIAQAIQNQSINLSAGHIDTSSNRIGIRSQQQAYSRKDFEQIVIRSDNNSIIKLADIADIQDTYKEGFSFSHFLNKNSIQLNVEFLGDGSITAAAGEVKNILDKLEHAYWIPKDLNISTWADESESIKDRLRMMTENGLLGIVLVFIILALFLNSHIAFWVAIGIPVSFAGTLALMSPDYFDLSINLLTTFGFIIVLGIVVDDAIIIGESIYTSKTENQHALDNPIEATINGVSKVAVPAIFGVLTTVAAFFPLTQISGELGLLFKQIVIVVIVCLLFSIVESKLILPSHLAYHSMKDKPKNLLSRLLHNLRQWVDMKLQMIIHRYYQPTITLIIKHRYNALCGFIALFLLTLSLIPSGVVKSELFPDIESDYIELTLKLQDGLTETSVNTISHNIESSLLTLNSDLQTEWQLSKPAILHIHSYAESLTHIQFTVQLMPGSERTFSKQSIVSRWREQLNTIGEIETMRFEEDDDSDIYIALLGDNLTELNQASKELVKSLSPLKGVEDVRSSFESGELSMNITLLPSAHLLGLTQQDVTEQIRSALYGYEAQSFQRGQDDIPVMVRLDKSHRDIIYDLNDLQLQTPNGDKVDLSSVVELQTQKALKQILRYKHQRVVLVLGSINEAVANDKLDEALKALTDDLVKRYPSINVQLEGDAAEEEKVMLSLAKGFVLGLLLIYVLLAIPLKSYLEPLLIMGAIPFGIIGAIAGHWLIGLEFTLLSFFGVLALSGVVVNDALILANRYNQLKEEVGDAKTAIIQAGVSRFRAIILTSLTTFVGLIPLLLERSEQAQIIIPMAVSLAFGVLFATIVTLFIIPVLLIISDDFNSQVKQKNQDVYS